MSSRRVCNIVAHPASVELPGFGIPALPAVWAALALLESESHSGVTGLTGLAELIDQPQIFANLREQGYTVDHQVSGTTDPVDDGGPDSSK